MIMKKIYLAAPFFTPDQLALVQQFEVMINGTPGLTLYSPRSAGILKDMPAEERPDKEGEIFDLNHMNIRACDLVFALLDYVDYGTTWETGYAFREFTPIVTYHYDRPIVDFNLMLRKSVAGHVRGLDNAARFFAALALRDKGVLAEFAVNCDLSIVLP